MRSAHVTRLEIPTLMYISKFYEEKYYTFTNSTEDEGRAIMMSIQSVNDCIITGSSRQHAITITTTAMEIVTLNLHGIASL
jgi:hypothetical protein